MSDDGEPPARRPAVLEVLRRHDLGGVLAASSRYYGGVNLGASGLVRAYTDADRFALQAARRVERVARGTLTVGSAYADEAHVRHSIEQKAARYIDSAYAMLVKMTIHLPSTPSTTPSAR